MKINGRRQSKNIEVQSDKQREAAGYGKKLQDQVIDNQSFLHNSTPVGEWGDARPDLVKEITNPARSRSAFPTIRTPGERRKVKDPSPSKMSKTNSQKDFQFFKHHITEK